MELSDSRSVAPNSEANLLSIICCFILRQCNLCCEIIGRPLHKFSMRTAATIDDYSVVSGSGGHRLVTGYLVRSIHMPLVSFFEFNSEQLAMSALYAFSHQRERYICFPTTQRLQSTND